MKRKKGRRTNAAVSAIASGLPACLVPLAVPGGVGSSVDTGNLIPRPHVRLGASLETLEAEKIEVLAVGIVKVRVDVQAHLRRVVWSSTGLDARDDYLFGSHLEFFFLLCEWIFFFLSA